MFGVFGIGYSRRETNDETPTVRAVCSVNAILRLPSNVSVKARDTEISREISLLFFDLVIQMLDATTAAHSLITLASPPLHDKKDEGMTTPPRPNVQNMEYESPDHTRHLSIKCKGTKRPRENLVLVLYDAGETELAVPLIRGEDPQLFFERRNKIAKETLEADMRNDVYCTWRREMMSILINDKRWKLVRDSPQQKRYAHDAIQLVLT